MIFVGGGIVFFVRGTDRSYEIKMSVCFQKTPKRQPGKVFIPPPVSIDSLSMAPDALVVEYRASPVGVAAAAARPLNPVISAMLDR